MTVYLSDTLTPDMLIIRSNAIIRIKKVTEDNLPKNMVYCIQDKVISAKLTKEFGITAKTAKVDNVEPIRLTAEDKLLFVQVDVSEAKGLSFYEIMHKI